VPRILILIGSHLCTAPRPQKEACALAAAGHEVTIAGGWFDPEFAAWDERLIADAPYRFKKVADLRPHAPGGHFRRWMSRLRRYLARRRFARTGSFTPELLGLFPRETRRFAGAFRADLTIAHSEGGLWVATRLQRDGLRVGVDYEDWFSEDLLPADRIGRPCATIREMEGALLRSCRYTVTTSGALSGELQRTFAAPAPCVVYNTFPEAPIDGRRIDRPDSSVPSLHWFSQTIGPSRGLETLFAALPLLHHRCQVTLRGRLLPAYRSWLESFVPGDRRASLHILPLVPNSELPSRLAEHDVGLALEQADNPSRDLTITNKFFQYLQAGLAVIATDTRGQQEAARLAPAACALVPQRNAAALAAAIDVLLADAQGLARAKAAAREAAQTVFAWERQQKVLTARAQEALSTVS
jgi:glycosyltransferase involved in cell wall biosynthesis